MVGNSEKNLVSEKETYYKMVICAIIITINNVLNKILKIEYFYNIN